MAKLRIELQVTLLAVVIAVAVIASGYLAYKSLSGIVYSVQKEANPGHQLFLIKDIASDLASIENTVRLYVLTNNENNLEPYNELKEIVIEKLGNLQETSTSEYYVLVNTFNSLAAEKLEIWEGVMNLHRSSIGMEKSFTEIYSKLEINEVDTIVTETREKGFLGGIFGKNRSGVDTINNNIQTDTATTKPAGKGLLGGIFKREKVRYDTLIVEKSVERDALIDEIQNLESNIKETDTQVNILESKLIERNEEIGKKLSQLILRRENFETERRLSKTREADHLAQITYKWLAVFSAAAVLLLLAVIYLLFNYQKKSRAYQLALQKAKQEAENLARAKEQFAANVSHEMRTPVNAIYSLSEQLLQKSTGSTKEKQLSIIARSANHLKSIINDTLDFSKIQARKIKIDSVNFSPASVFEEVIAEQETEAEKKGIALKYNSAEPLPSALMGDPLRLKQILINLVSNAIKFTEKGEVVLNVNAEKGSEGQINLNIEVADTGIGISKENLELIFDEFVQLENTGGKKYSGTGLGLSIVKSLVELQDGSISVKSEPGEGTAIFVSIPYYLGEEDKIEIQGIKAPDIPDHFRERSVLIADDEEFNRYVLKNILNKWGMKYQEATNGEEAVAKALSGTFDIILMDMRMPKKNGTEASEEIIKSKPDSKIVAVTAAEMNNNSEDYRKAGMVGFLMKPFSENDLYKAIYPFIDVTSEKKSSGTGSKIDPAGLERLSNGDTVFLKEMISLFIKTSENSLMKIKEAAAAEDWEAVSETAHKLAAPSKHLNADNLYDKLKKLESISRDAADPEIITNLCKNVEEEAGEVIAFLQAYLNHPGNK
ncbi:MAG: ATP-binding protein [Prolixibacteraceae bacterium]|nr:ATP-binding protein [Prolixibacteraceae bacterium]